MLWIFTSICISRAVRRVFGFRPFSSVHFDTDEFQILPPFHLSFLCVVWDRCCVSSVLMSRIRRVCHGGERCVTFPMVSEVELGLLFRCYCWFFYVPVFCSAVLMLYTRHCYGCHFCALLLDGTVDGYIRE